jgi:DNA-binding transcriptional LysR family regulator
MRRNIDTSLLRSFVAVAETGSMTTAAKQLHLTQAAVSQQIKRLEELFDRSLFDREQRRLALTSSGGMLLAKAPRLLAMNDELWATMTAPEFVGEVRLGVPGDIISAYIPPILKSFDKAWPDVRVFIVAGVTVDLQEQLKNGTIDLCLTTEESPKKGGERLLREPLVWVGAPHGTAYLRDPLPLALGDRSCIFRNAVLERLAKAGRHCDAATLRQRRGRSRCHGPARLVGALQPHHPRPGGRSAEAAGLPHLPLSAARRQLRHRRRTRPPHPNGARPGTKSTRCLKPAATPFIDMPGLL